MYGSHLHHACPTGYTRFSDRIVGRDKFGITRVLRRKYVLCAKCVGWHRVPRLRRWRREGLLQTVRFNRSASPGDKISQRA